MPGWPGRVIRERWAGCGRAVRGVGVAERRTERRGVGTLRPSSPRHPAPGPPPVTRIPDERQHPLSPAPAARGLPPPPPAGSPSSYGAQPPSPYGGYGAPAAYGAPGGAPLGKVRGTGVCIVLAIVTFGIYSLYWYFKTTRR